MALKRAFRLRKNGEFQRVRQRGRHVTSRLLILAWAPNDETHLRIGFVISKRVSKHAVARNYFKRLLSVATRSVLARISGSWDIVLSAKHQITSADLPTLTDDITILLRRARLLNSR